jgi:hypothetical protein
MFQRIRNLIRPHSRAGRRPVAPRPTFRVEALEDRALMATYAGSLGTFTGVDDYQPGRTVGYSDVGTIVQVSQVPGQAITAEIISSTTGALVRTVTVPNTSWASGDLYPTIGVSTGGRFVVAWQHAANGNFANLDVRAQPFDASGNAVGGTVTVASSAYYESEPSVGVDGKGNFAVAYTIEDLGSLRQNVNVRQFNALGGFLRTVVVNPSTMNVYSPSLDMNASGQFVVAYTADYSSTDQDVYATGFTAAGARQTYEAIATSTVPESGASAAIDASGNYVVAYTVGTTNTQVQLRRVSSAGSLGAPISVGFTANSEGAPSVDMAADGRFVVSYAYWLSSIDDALYIQEFSASGTAVGSAFLVANTTNYVNAPKVAMNSAGSFAVGYVDYLADGTSYQTGSRYFF